MHGYALKYIYEALPIPSTEVKSLPEMLKYVLIWVSGPVFAMQWFIFELKAVSRFITGDDRFKALGKKSVSNILDRV